VDRYELITGLNKQYKKISWNVADEEDEKPKSKKEVKPYQADPPNHHDDTVDSDQ